MVWVLPKVEAGKTVTLTYTAELPPSGELEDKEEVANAAAVGKPDPLRTEIVKAFIVLKRGVAESPELAADITRFVKERLSAHEYPREIAFTPDLPLTTTGKVIRRELRARA